MKTGTIGRLGVAAAAALAIGLGAPGSHAQTKTKKPTTAKKVEKKVVKKGTTKRKSKPVKVGSLFVTYYNAKWSQASAGKCGKQYRLYTAAEKKAAKGQTRKLYTQQIKLCGKSYWATKRAATCASSHRRARNTAVLRRYDRKGSYKALCPRGAQANIAKAAAARKSNFKKGIKKKPVTKTTTRKKSS